MHIQPIPLELLRLDTPCSVCQKPGCLPERHDPKWIEEFKELEHSIKKLANKN